MAKRSVRRAREQARASQEREPKSAAPGPPEPTWRSRQFWLGALAAACVLIPLAIAGVVLAGGAETPRAQVVPEPTFDTAAEAKRIEEENKVRDKEQVTDLTELMRREGTELDPVVRGIARTLPPEDDDKVGPLASEREADRWVKQTRQAAATFEESPSGETDTNVARGAFAAAVRGLARTTETYRLALRQPKARRALLDHARAQRDDALRAWETASVQIDVINIAAGFGHQHPPIPGGASNAPDDLPEGTGARDGG